MKHARSAFFTPGSDFTIEDVPLSPPGRGEVRIAIGFCGICGTDQHIFHGAMAHRLGDRRVLGHEASGVIQAIGEGVDDFSLGDRVVVRPLSSCGTCPACKAGHTHVCQNLKFLGIDTDGGFSEAWTVPAETVHHLPEGISLKSAALVEPTAVACHDVRRGRVAPGEDVLVIGGGPIGILVAIAAREAGARVTVSEINDSRLALIGKLGFDAINPSRDDVAATMMEKTGGKGADVVFEVSGAQAGLNATTAVAAVRGRIVVVAIYPEAPSIEMFQYFWKELELIGARVYEAEDYDRAIAMIADGKVDAAALITDVHPLDHIGAAFAGLDGSGAAMKTLIEVSGELA
ncbi:zinc-dependent alcohol dehydrogenase [Rhodobium gokarnense]|uniref:2-desacetyl-2-hydroxyethyl bacteriochlorophyllide A dehydrogenase n=1 Tax=Rhodobium gokarnense TaxID=364296 RepID=A0ABT3H7D1_9HYPH|nr:alcohol dehydrogenase catalytic domain-containing protein [Rhodobium gokarnense]MCW2306312.1 2-desacetyl-2-hydroxyethyl bacteriochlorophyllide A dehydrogenase [Rhodobium gokarnense]